MKTLFPEKNGLDQIENIEQDRKEGKISNMALSAIIIPAAIIIYISPLIHILASNRSHGGAKIGWFLAYLFFLWIAYIVFLIVTQENADRNKFN